jgi:hypothetical protein
VELAEMGAVFLGAETAADRATVAVAACGELEGHLLVNLLAQVAAVDAVDYLNGVTQSPKALGLVIDRRSDSAALGAALDNAGVATTDADAKMVAVASGRFLDLLAGGMLRHLNQPALSAAIRAASRRTLVGAFAFGRRPDADQSPLLASALAVSAYIDWASTANPSIYLI